MLSLNLIALLEREHEVKLTTSLVISERVDEKIEVVDFLHLFDKSVYLAQEVLWVYVVD